MIPIKDFKISSLQATLFTPGLSFSSQTILSHFLKDWGKIFDYAPISLPSDPNMPAEIPRIILQSSNKQYKIEFSLARVNLFWISNDGNKEISSNYFYDLSGKILCDYKNLIGAKVGRLAGVFNRINELKSPVSLIINQFCKRNLAGKVFRNCDNFEIHSHKRYELTNTYPVNSWIRFKTGFKGKRSDNIRILIIQQDINTLSEELETRDYSNEEINLFFRTIVKEFNDILRLFFSTRIKK